jgi:predicted  nucleic acid-binding Zn-ribbon protein
VGRHSRTGAFNGEEPTIVVKLKEQIEALERLAELDAELAIVEQELKGRQDVLSDKRQELKRLEDKFASTRASVGEMDRMRGELMTEVRQMSVQMERSREKLARSRTEREVNAVQREIEELRKLYRDREIEVEKLNGLSEQVRVDMDSSGAERAALVGDLGANEGALTTIMGELEQTLAEKRDRRQGLVKAVQPVVYRRYEMIRKRRGSAIAHTTLGTCSACHMTIAPMMFQQLRRAEEFAQCPSCQRILYYRPDGDAAEGKPDETADTDDSESSESPPA